MARRDEKRRLRETILRDDPNRGELVIACSGSFAMLLYSHLLPVMHAAPHLVVRLEAMPQDSIVAGVLSGRIDLGVVSREPDRARLQVEHLGREALCLVVPAEANPAPIDFAMLQALGFIAHPDGYAYADELFALNFPDVFEGSERLRVRGFVNQISQIPAPVAQGIGYTILPRSGVSTYPDRHRLHIASLPRTRHDELYLVSRKGRLLTERVIRVAALVKTVAGKLESD